MPRPQCFEIRSNEAGAFLKIEKKPQRGSRADALEDGYWIATPGGTPTRTARAAA
jgi:hypothetical protein